MAKFQGIIGYVKTEETSPGIYEPIVTEIPCQGDILRDNRRWNSAESLNDDITINNRFSFVASDEMLQDMQFIKYISWNNVKWKVDTIEIQRPRLILTVRGVWNGI